MILLSVQVEALLEQGVDPAEKDSRGRTAYSIAGDKQIRDTFRRYYQCSQDAQTLSYSEQQQHGHIVSPGHDMAAILKAADNRNSAFTVQSPTCHFGRQGVSFQCLPMVWHHLNDVQTKPH